MKQKNINFFLISSLQLQFPLKKSIIALDLCKIMQIFVENIHFNAINKGKREV